jgi:hypothetical protein
MIDPYAPPDQNLPADPQTQVQKSLSRPATALVIMSSCHSVFYSIEIISHAFSWNSSDSPFRSIHPLGIASFLFLCQVFIAIGAAKMGRMESYRMGMVGMALASIPIVSPFYILGIPFGIWGLTALIPARNAFSHVDPIPTRT